MRVFESVKGVEALEGKSVKESFSDETSVRELIAKISEPRFIELLNGLNGIIRGIKKESWGMTERAMQISGVMESETVTTPSLEDRPRLLTRLLDAAKDMNSNGRNREDIALLISVTINAIHP